MRNRITAGGGSFARCSIITALLLGTSALALSALPVLANPLGGTITTGSATISAPSSKQTTVNQKSEGVVIDWSSFNIGSGQTTNFLQPNKSAIAVNRIGSANASNILGTLDANGRVVLINGNGILFGKNAQVNVGSLVATSTDGSDADVLAGKFTKAGSQSAAIINRGSIEAAAHGTVALVAPNVSNKGIVEARFGTVSLGGANAFSVDFKGDGLVSFAAQGDVNGKASVVNKGTLAGAAVQMTAHAAEGIATGVVNTSGIVEATAAHGAGGTILLDAGNGNLKTGGLIDAAGKTGGGAIETSGNAVSIAGKITSGKGGNWTIDPQDLTIDSTAASSINGALSGDTNVTEQTTSTTASGFGNVSSGPGNIYVDSEITWSTGATLTLNAFNVLDIDAPIVLTGAGELNMTASVDPGYLQLNFAKGGYVNFTDIVGSHPVGTLMLNSHSYTLENTLLQLATDIATTPGGYFALADSYNASADGTYSASPITSAFSGTFEGLGNTIGNVSISNPGGPVGLFNTAINNFAIRDLILSGVLYGSEGGTGGLVGSTSGVGGVIQGVSVSGSITTTEDNTGGLVGIDTAEIINSSSNVTVETQGSNVGGLVGVLNNGSILQSDSTGSVSTLGGQAAGGLVGFNNGGTITRSFSSGEVAAPTYAGGLIGQDGGGTITDSYSMAAVSGGYAGGLVGDVESGTLDINTSFAVGYVNASLGSGGGLVAKIDGGGAAVSATNAYWDTGTTGQTTSAGGAGSGVSTSALQTSLETGLNDGAFAIVANLSYPYLLWQSPSSAPQVIAGSAGNFSTPTPTALTGQSVGAFVDGAAVSPLAAMSSGANGYFYLLVPTGTISASGSNVFAYLNSGTTGNAFNQGVTGSVTGLIIAEDGLFITTSANTASSILSAMNTALGGASGSEFIYTSGAGFAANATTTILDMSKGLNIDTSLDMNGGALAIQDAGKITEAGGAIDASIFGSLSDGGAALTSANNEIGELGTFNNTGGGNLVLTDSESLDVAGPVTNTGSPVSLTTTGAGHNISINGNLTAEVLRLYSAGSIGEDITKGSVDAAYLEGTSVGGALMEGTNLVANLAGFTNTGGGNIALTSGESLNMSGAVSNAGGRVDLTTTGANHKLSVSRELTAVTVDLVSAANIVESSTNGGIDATVLEGSSVGGVSLQGTNSIDKLLAFTNTGGGDFVMTDGTTVAVDGAVNAGTGMFSLTTENVGDFIYIENDLTAGTVGLFAGGEIHEDATHGAIIADTLTGSSSGAASLNGANQVGILSAFSDKKAPDDNFSFNDTESFATLGAIDYGVGNIKLATTGAGSNIMIESTLTAGSNVTLDSSGTVSENLTFGRINTSTLTGASVGGTLLPGPNMIGALNAFTNTGGGNVELEDFEGLKIDGTVNAGTGEVVLHANGAIDESKTAGAIDAGSFGSTAEDGVSLNGANQIGTLDSFQNSDVGAFTLTDDATLKVAGYIVNNVGGITLTTTGAGHDLLIDDELLGITVTLNSAGTISEKKTYGEINANVFSGTSVGGASLQGPNTFEALKGFTNTGGGSVSITDGQSLVVDGAVGAGAGDLALTANGSGSSLDIGAALTGGVVTLDASGLIDESKTNGVITAAALNGSSAGGASLQGANMVTDLDAFSNTGGGGISFVNAQALTVRGLVSGGGNTNITTTSGNLTLAGDISGIDITLGSDSGRVKQTAGAITAGDVLTVNAYGDITLDDGNSYRHEYLNSTHGTTTGH